MEKSGVGGLNRNALKIYSLSNRGSKIDELLSLGLNAAYIIVLGAPSGDIPGSDGKGKLRAAGWR
jgi:hypothetical protein